MLRGKTVILGVTGGIAAYKSAYLTSLLVKAGADVQVIMTEHAREFISPLTFEGLTNQRCHTDTFDRNHEYSTEHISLASRADAVIIAPATANVIARLACGIADDMLTTTVLACDCPKIIVPAMNTRMYENPVTQDNMERLRGYGMTWWSRQPGGWPAAMWAGVRCRSRTCFSSMWRWPAPSRRTWQGKRSL